MDRGTPSNTASDAAREKLSTEVIETIVDARQRFRPLRSVDLVATEVGRSVTGNAIMTRGPNTESATNSTGARDCLEVSEE